MNTIKKDEDIKYPVQVEQAILDLMSNLDICTNQEHNYIVRISLDRLGIVNDRQLVFEKSFLLKHKED